MQRVWSKIVRVRAANSRFYCSKPGSSASPPPVSSASSSSASSSSSSPSSSSSSSSSTPSSSSTTASRKPAGLLASIFSSIWPFSSSSSSAAGAKSSAAGSDEPGLTLDPPTSPLPLLRSIAEEDARRLSRASEAGHLYRAIDECIITLPRDENGNEVRLAFDSWEEYVESKGGFRSATETGAANMDRIASSKKASNPSSTSSAPLSEAELKHMHRFLSEMLTYPMTLSMSLPLLVRDMDPARPVIICFAGSRREAMLPHHVWVTLLQTYPGFSFHVVHIGPDVPKHLHEKNLKVTKGLELSWIASTVKDAASGTTLKETAGMEFGAIDLFILAHSGIGQPDLGEMWQSSVETMLSTKAPLLFTSFDQKDVEDDTHGLRQAIARCGRGGSVFWPIEATENPACSYLPTIDPAAKSDSRVSFANRFIFAVNEK